MECVILAGGLGTRMRPFTERVPKWLLPVCGKPFADWQLDWLETTGITRIIVAAGHLKSAIDGYVRETATTRRFEIVVSDDGPDLLGTAGGLRQAMQQHLTGRGALVLYGDSYLTLDVDALWETSNRGDVAIMSVFENDGQWDASNAEVSGDRVVRFEKGLADPRAAGLTYIDYGMSVMPRDQMMTRVPGDVSFDLADVFTAISRDDQLGAFVVKDRFFEAGSPAGLADLEAHLRRISIA